MFDTSSVYTVFWTILAFKLNFQPQNPNRCSPALCAPYANGKFRKKPTKFKRNRHCLAELEWWSPRGRPWQRWRPRWRRGTWPWQRWRLGPVAREVTFESDGIFPHKFDLVLKVSWPGVPCQRRTWWVSSEGPFIGVGRQFTRSRKLLKHTSLRQN